VSHGSRAMDGSAGAMLDAARAKRSFKKTSLSRVSGTSPPRHHHHRPRGRPVGAATRHCTCLCTSCVVGMGDRGPSQGVPPCVFQPQQNSRAHQGLPQQKRLWRRTMAGHGPATHLVERKGMLAILSVLGIPDGNLPAAWEGAQCAKEQTHTTCSTPAQSRYTFHKCLAPHQRAVVGSQGPYRQRPLESEIRMHAPGGWLRVSLKRTLQGQLLVAPSACTRAGSSPWPNNGRTGSRGSRCRH
jgi:hypothetical protein